MEVGKVRGHAEGRNVGGQWEYIPDIPGILVHAHTNRSPYFIAAGS